MSGYYRFDFTNLTYSGVTTVNSGQISFRLGNALANSLATFTSANKLRDDVYRTEPGWFASYGGGSTRVEGLLTAGTTYWIRAAASNFGTTNEATVDFDISWDLIPAPSNDNFASATALSTTLPGSLVGQSTYIASSQAGEPNPWYSADDHQSLWYTFTPSSSGRYRFTFDNIARAGFIQQKLGFALYTGSTLAGLTLVDQFLVGSTGPPITHFSRVLDLTSGTTYRIQLTSPIFNPDPFNSYVASFDMGWETVSVGSPPANDDLADVTDLGSDPPDGSIPGTTLGATFEAWEETGGYNQPSVWYRFHNTTATSRELHLIRSEDNQYYRPYYEIYKILSDPPASYDDLEFVDYGRLDLVGDESHAYSGTFAGPAPIDLEAATDYVLYIGNWDFNGESDDYTFYFGAISPPATPPDNDSPGTTPQTHDFYFDRSEWGAYWVYPEASERAGTTVMASADTGEPALAGHTSVRTVWYHLGISNAGTYRIWVESAVDCLLGVYREPTYWSNVSDLTLAFSDDDSGTGNQPELNVALDRNAPNFGDYWIAVDSRSEGTFTLKYQRQSGGTPPANDNFASATVIGSLPFSASGTTVAATAETQEREAEFLGNGPKDTVWYKYVADHNGPLSIKATCNSSNLDAYVYVDVWRGTAPDNLVRDPEPPQDSPIGFFGHFDSTLDLDAQAVIVDIVNGQTYYFRVQTESGGSEDFTIYVENQSVHLDLLPSGSDEMHGTLIDSASVYLDLRHTGTEVFHQATTLDAATVQLRLTPSAPYEQSGHQYTDTGTAYLDITVLGGECYSRFHFTGEGEADTRWDVVDVRPRWTSDVETRWSTTIEVQPGCH